MAAVEYLAARRQPRRCRLRRIERDRHKRIEDGSVVFPRRQLQIAQRSRPPARIA
jgi:hypothetical protein